MTTSNVSTRRDFPKNAMAGLTVAGPLNVARAAHAACGDGVIDWKRIIDIARRCPRDIVFSVECGSIEQAARSIEHLRTLL